LIYVEPASQYLTQQINICQDVGDDKVGNDNNCNKDDSLKFTGKRSTISLNRHINYANLIAFMLFRHIPHRN
jgi:hypothetical protein